MLVHFRRAPRCMVGCMVAGCFAMGAVAAVVAPAAGAEPVTLPTTAPSPAQSADAMRRFDYYNQQMGMVVHLLIFSADEDTARDAGRAAFHRIEQIEQIMSDYRPDSELMKLCAKAGGPPIAVSDELFAVLQRARQVSGQCDGVFDVTVGPMVALWRRARKTHQLPTDAEIATAKSLVGYEKMKLDPEKHTVQLLVAGMKLDLGGIAKGYAGDCALAAIRKYGLTHALYEAGGDVVVGDPPPGKAGWTVVLGDGKDDAAGPRRIEIANAAASTSGDTRQFVEIAGKRYSHIVDVHTGLGMADTPWLVTVVAPDGMTSDSLSKPALILGPAKGESVTKLYPGTKVYYREPKHEGSEPPK